MKIVQNVLLLGNAFVLKNDLRGRLEALSTTLNVGVCAFPEMTLEEHVEASASCIEYTDWDVVVLQEDNRVAMDNAWTGRSSVPAVRALVERTRTRNPNARVVLFQPWVFRHGYSSYSPGDMHTALLDAYVRIAAESVRHLEYPRYEVEISFVGSALLAMSEEIDHDMLWEEDMRTPRKLMTSIASIVLFQTITGNLPVNLPIRYKIPDWTATMM